MQQGAPATPLGHTSGGVAAPECRWTVEGVPGTVRALHAQATPLGRARAVSQRGAPAPSSKRLRRRGAKHQVPPHRPNAAGGRRAAHAEAPAPPLIDAAARDPKSRPSRPDVADPRHASQDFGRYCGNSSTRQKSTHRKTRKPARQVVRNACKASPTTSKCPRDRRTARGRGTESSSLPARRQPTQLDGSPPRQIVAPFGVLTEGENDA